AATGNEGASGVYYPANLSASNAGVVATGASTDADVWAAYSGYGPEITLLAPSNGGSFGVVTTDRTGGLGYNAGDYTSGGEFGYTSATAPETAGVGALILARDIALNGMPTLTATQVRGLLKNTTDLIGDSTVTYDNNGFNIKYGYGRLNADTAVQG